VESVRGSSGGQGGLHHASSSAKPALSSGLSKGDNCDNCGEHRTGATGDHHISYSVSYFNYTVSTSEDECDFITVSLNRMKIRKSSRERNENLKDKDRQA